MSLATVSWLVLAVSLIAAATVALCLGHISSHEWLTTVGPAGVLGAAGAHLSGRQGP